MTQTVNDTVTPFVVKASVQSDASNCPAGHRLVTVSWKQTKELTDKGITVRSACAVAIPIVTVAVQPEALNTALNECVADFQDKIIAEIVNAALAANSAVMWDAIKIEPDSVTVQGIADWTALQAEKGRLSKQAIGNWFDTMLAGPLTTALAKLPGVTSEIITASLASHRDSFTTLASPRANMPAKLVKQLQAAIKLAPGEDKVKVGLTAKLASFIKPAIQAMEFALPTD